MTRQHGWPNVRMRLRACRRLPVAAAMGLAMALSSADAPANPVPVRTAEEMNARPGRWLANPTPEDKRLLISQFANYGVSRSLLSPATLKLLERNFDRFSPILVAAQRPPNYPQGSLQRWFREHANRKQSEAMTAALREWLTASLTEAPMSGYSRITGPPRAVEEVIQGARLQAVEALGDWGDLKSLPDLFAMLHATENPSPVLVGAIRRITDPSRAEVLTFDRSGRVVLERPDSELDSMMVECTDRVTEESPTWRADPAGIQAIRAALSDGRRAEQSLPSRPDPKSFTPWRVEMHFRDGVVAGLERSSGGWTYRDNSRPSDWIEVTSPAMDRTLDKELMRVGIAPMYPRFVAESVSLFISPGQLWVQGSYEFEGAPVDGRLPLIYPIATGGGLGIPHIDRVELRSDEYMNYARLPASFEQHESSCHIAMEPGKTHRYMLEVNYRQALGASSAKYLITTAREWGRPLRRAWFQVLIDTTLGEPAFSLPLEKMEIRGPRQRYRFEASPFRPDSDLVVSW